MAERKPPLAAVSLELREAGNGCLMGESPDWRFHLWLDPDTLKPVDDTVYKTPRASNAQTRTIRLTSQRGSGKLIAQELLSHVGALYPRSKAMLDKQQQESRARQAAEHAKQLAMAAGPDLLKAARSLVAMTLQEARAADDAGHPKLYCRCDALNPCWSPGMTITSPLHHWGDPESGPACDECSLRAAVALATGSPRC